MFHVKTHQVCGAGGAVIRHVVGGGDFPGAHSGHLPRFPDRVPHARGHRSGATRHSLSNFAWPLHATSFRDPRLFSTHWNTCHTWSGSLVPVCRSSLHSCPFWIDFDFDDGYFPFNRAYCPVIRNDQFLIVPVYTTGLAQKCYLNVMIPKLSW